MLKYLQNSLSEPYLLLKQFNDLKKDFQSFFKLEYLDSYPCEHCPERCCPKIINDKCKLFFVCESGYFLTPQEIKPEEIQRHRFCFDRLFQKLAEANYINLNIEPISQTAYLIGSKVITNKKNNYFYLHRLSLNNLEQQIYSIKTYFADSHRNIIITPTVLDLKETDIAFLNQHNSKIISLENILSNNFRIQLSEKLEQDFILVVNAENRTIILDGLEIVFGKNLKPFKCIYELALKPEEKVSSEIVSGFKKKY